MLIFTREQKKRQKQTAKKLRMITAAFMPQCGFPAWNGNSVNDWVGLMAHSSGTFTNSFHGTAFSLIFERPVSVAGNAGELAKRNGRIEELLKKADAAGAMGKDLWTPEPGKIAESLKEDREASIHFLKDILKDAADT